MTITKLKQVEEIANKFFKCAVRPVDDISAKGYKGVKLIVGMKRNPAYDPSINPDDPNLPIELRQNKELLRNKTNPEAPDVRILWIPPGTTEQELIDNFILKIKKSLDNKKPIVKKDPTLTKLEVESDADIAAKLASGDLEDERYDEWDDGFTDEELDEAVDEILEEEKEKGLEPVDEQSGNTDLIMGALEQLGKNIETLSSDVGKLSNRVNNIEAKTTPKAKTKGKK